MKKLPIKLFIAVTAIIIGLVVGIIFVSPSYNSKEKVINKYISAINSENPDKMEKCMFGAKDYEALMKNNPYLGIFGGAGYTARTYDDTSRMGLLNEGCIASRIPEEAIEVNKVKLLGCKSNAGSSEWGVESYNCEILVEVTYTAMDGEDEKEYTICYGDTVNVMKGRTGYKIVD